MSTEVSKNRNLEPLEKATLLAVRDQLAAFGWAEAEVEELVAPKFGIISGLQELLRDLEALRQVDLGGTPPADGLEPGE